MPKKEKEPPKFKVVNIDASGKVIEDLSKITLSAEISLLYHQMIWKKGAISG